MSNDNKQKKHDKNYEKSKENVEIEPNQSTETQNTVKLDLETADQSNSKQSDDLNDQLAIANQKYVRVLADYQNLQKRMTDEKLSMIIFANQDLLTKLLPIYDDLLRAGEHLNDAGLNSVITKLTKFLNDFGITQMQIILSQTDFDSSMHEAIETCDGPNQKIVKLYRNGYLLNSKVIQTAIVAVGNQSNN